MIFLPQSQKFQNFRQEPGKKTNFTFLILSQYHRSSKDSKVFEHVLSCKWHTERQNLAKTFYLWYLCCCWMKHSDMSVGSIGSKVVFKSMISLLTCCLGDRCIHCGMWGSKVSYYYCFAIYFTSTLVNIHRCSDVVYIYLQVLYPSDEMALYLYSLSLVMLLT